MTTTGYLRPDIIIEPLVDQWYAWSYNISPMTSGLYLANRYIRIMDSFIQAAEIHQNAVNNPSLRGGSFIELGCDRVEDIRNLLEDTQNNRQEVIEFAASIKEANILLKENSGGMPLTSLYAKLPEALQGYVELVYDLQGNPFLRFLEPLLYRSKYYDTTAQSFMLFRKDKRDRPFVHSTPSLEDEFSLKLDIPFSDKLIDELYYARNNSVNIDDLCELLGISDSKDSLFRSFFCDKAPPKTKGQSEEYTVRWRYFGHACVLLESGGKSILIDPIFSGSVDDELQQYTIFDLPEKIDYVVITHNHHDHIIFEMLLQIRSRIGMIIVPRSSSGLIQDPSLKLLLTQTGFKNVIELDLLESIDFDGGFIMGLPFLGEHGDLDIQSKNTYLIKIGGRSFMFAADCNLLEPKLYEYIHELVGDIETLFIGTESEGAPLNWVYGSLLDRPAKTSRRLNGADSSSALALAKIFCCNSIYIYGMGYEPWLNYISRMHFSEDSAPVIESEKLITLCKRQGMKAERLYGSKKMEYF